jgi:hypothetical protein
MPRAVYYKSIGGASRISWRTECGRLDFLPDGLAARSMRRQQEKIRFSRVSSRGEGMSPSKKGEGVSCGRIETGL